MSSNTPRQPVSDLRFFLTVPHSCSYLPGKEATTLFLDPKESPGQSVYDALTLLGFRRSGQHLYRPHCDGCNACISVRIPVADFAPNRTQRRLMRRNADLEVNVFPAQFSSEHYDLYARYICTRHHDGDMFPPSHEQYRTFLSLDQPWARLMEFRLHGELVAVSAFDELQHGLSAIYTFFAPGSQFDNRSLGTQAVLTLVQRAANQGLPHVYLGYWIEECRKMSYKRAFKPLERLDGRQWRRMIGSS